MLVDHGRLFDVLGSEGQLLTAATQDAHPGWSVSGVSGRTVSETVRHIGDLCEDALSWLGSSESAARTLGLPDDAGLRANTSRFTSRLAQLLAEFGTRPGNEPCPTWWPGDHSMSFWLRRIVHATTVHRVDVQTAAGIEMTPIDPDVALDGIDEVLRLWLGYRLHALGIAATRPCTIRVQVAAQSWQVCASSEHTVVTRTVPHAQTEDAVISGDPSVVYLWLWGRLPDRAVQTDGDHDAVAQLWGLLRLATQ